MSNPVEHFHIDEVFKMYRDNNWLFAYCIRQVSNLRNVDYHDLLKECGSSMRTKTRKKKFKNPNEAYNGKIPYWIN